MSDEASGSAVSETPTDPTGADGDLPRRSLLARIGNVAMIGGLLAGYGTLAAYFGRFLYPPEPTARRWMFVADLASFDEGTSRVFLTPAGAPVNITRRSRESEASGFVALSSTCPHLGCQVHWEPQNSRYFCPCHNGVFDPSGQPISGPPADAGQSLVEYPLRVTDGLLFIEVPTDSLADTKPGGRPGTSGSPPGPGHDPCLYASTQTVERG